MNKYELIEKMVAQDIIKKDYIKEYTITFFHANKGAEFIEIKSDNYIFKKNKYYTFLNQQHIFDVCYDRIENTFLINECGDVKMNALFEWRIAFLKGVK